MRLSAKDSRNPLDAVRMKQFEEERRRKKSINLEPSRGRMHFVINRQK